MTVLVKTESSVKKLVWVSDGYINSRPPSPPGGGGGGSGSVWGDLDFTVDPKAGKGSSSYRSGGGRRPKRGKSDYDYYEEIVGVTSDGSNVTITSHSSQHGGSFVVIVTVVTI